MDNYNVLVIDDEPFILDIFSNFLCDEGYDVQTSQSNEEALSYLYKSSFDLILIDLHNNIGALSFSDFISKVRSGSFCNVPIIVVTGAPFLLSDEDHRLVQVVLEKPFLPETLIDSVNTLINKKPVLASS